MFVTLILGLVLAPAALAQSSMTSTTRAEACSEHCDYCSYDRVCRRCVTGYGITRLAICIECGRGCASCYDSIYAAGIQCSYCKHGYGIIVDPTTGLRQCLACPDNCDYCIGPDLVCDQCMDGFGGPQCAPIRTECAERENCRTCYDGEDETICLNCEEGFGLNSANECEVCSDGCRSCRDYGTGQVQCSRCFYGYGYVLDRRNNAAFCLKCPDNCKTCRNPEAVVVCDWCEDGFTGRNCHPIVQECSDDACHSCYGGDDGSEICTNCAEGYGIDSNQQCMECSEGCADCYGHASAIDGMRCNWCREGYGYSYNSENSSYLCVQCPPNCETCTEHISSGAPGQDVRCNTCKPGFVGPACTLALSVLPSNTTSRQ